MRPQRISVLRPALRCNASDECGQKTSTHGAEHAHTVPEDPGRGDKMLRPFAIPSSNTRSSGETELYRKSACPVTLKRQSDTSVKFWLSLVEYRSHIRAKPFISLYGFGVNSE